MSLNSYRIPANFRDVGEWVNTISGRSILPPRRILRGGKLDFVRWDMGPPGTIVNLRRGPDPAKSLFGADAFHFPKSNEIDCYDTHTPKIRRWLESVLGALERHISRYPVFFHCTSGKDRTGVVVAALLCTLGVERSVIVEEYLLSEGLVARDLLERAVDAIGDPRTYFRRIDLDALVSKVRGESC